jgi:hypothetical protein
MTKVIIAAAVALVLGLLIGFFAGRAMLERQWRQPQMQLDPGRSTKLAQDDADPVPAGGTKVFRAMPLERTRLAAKEITKSDPLVMNVGAIGNGDEGAELHLELLNNAKCTITSFTGIAYGFDAWGAPAKLNKHGEHFVAFSPGKDDDVAIEPGKTYLHAQKLRYPETASLAVAHVDSYTCKEGTSWKRP